MSYKMKRYLGVLLVAVTLFLSQVACDEELDVARREMGDQGCADTALRDACGTDTRCRIAACQNQ